MQQIAYEVYTIIYENVLWCVENDLNEGYINEMELEYPK